MKKLTLLLIVIVPLLAFAQTPIHRPSHFLSEFQKSVFAEKQFQLPAKGNFETKLKQFENLKKPKNTVPDRDKIEQKLTERYPNHKAIKRIRESLANYADETLLDSVLTYYFNSAEDSTLVAKIIYEYNDAAQHCFFSAYKLDTFTGKWMYESQEEYFPDELGRDTLKIFFSASTSANEWIPQTKIENAFDANKNQTKTAWYTWDANNHIWIGEYKTESVYDKNNHQILDAFYFWDYYANKWIGNYKEESEYDSNGNQISIAYSIWDETKNSWKGIQKVAYGYNSEGIQNSYIYYVWNESENKWIVQNKEERTETSNENGFEIAYFTYNWNAVSSKWILQHEVYYVYDLNSGEYTYTSKRRNDISGEMVNEEKMEIKVDELGNTWYEKRFMWNSSTDEWELNSKQEFLYDDQNRNVEDIESLKKDTFIASHLICGLDSVEAIENLIGDYSCPDNDCLKADTVDFVEGEAALNWNYDARGTDYWGGFSQFEIKNIPDLTKDEGVFLYYKVQTPSNARFNLIFTESDGEEWRYENYDMLSGTSTDWKQLVVRFEELYISDYQNQINGILDLDDIETIHIQLFVDNRMFASGSILIDNFSGFISEKTSTWAIIFRNVKKYNKNGKVISDSTFYWNEHLQQLVPSDYFKAEYNERGRRTSYESYWWDYNMEKWYGQFKNESTYNERGFLTQSIDYSWDYYEMKWGVQNKTITEYNDIGLETLTETYYFDWYTNELIGDSKHELTYNSNNKKTSEAWYFWDNAQKNWIGNTKTEWIINIDNELVKELHYIWNYTVSDWGTPAVFYIEKYDIILNDKGNIDHEIIIQWNEDDQQWKPVRKMYYYYKSPATSAEIFQNPELSKLFEIYPNPASSVVNLSLINSTKATVVIFDSWGKAIKSINITTGVTPVQLHNVSPGFYIVKIKTPNGADTQKLVVQ